MESRNHNIRKSVSTTCSNVKRFSEIQGPISRFRGNKKAGHELNQRIFFSLSSRYYIFLFRGRMPISATFNRLSKLLFSFLLFLFEIEPDGCLCCFARMSRRLETKISNLSWIQTGVFKTLFRIGREKTS